MKSQTKAKVTANELHDHMSQEHFYNKYFGVNEKFTRTDQT